MVIMFNMHVCVHIDESLCVCTNVGHPYPNRGPQISKSLISFELIEIIQFCLKIYDLSRHPRLWVGRCMGGWLAGWIDR